MAKLNVEMIFRDERVMYLVIIDRMLEHYRDVLLARPTEKFQAMVQSEVMKYVIDGKEPAAEIQTAVMNIADDMMAGREVNLRAGDYIALMNHARAGKMI